MHDLVRRTSAHRADAGILREFDKEKREKNAEGDVKRQKGHQPQKDD